LKSLLPLGGSDAVPLAVYKYSRLAYQQAGKHDKSGNSIPPAYYIQQKGALPDALNAHG